MPTYIYRGSIDSSRREARERMRAEHLAYQATMTNLAGGPLTDEDGNATGSLIIFECPDRATAEARIAADPFVAHGVISDWTLDVLDAVRIPAMDA